MAGIGFQLKKLIDQDTSLIHKIWTYSYSLLVVYGPMFIYILCITLINGLTSLNGMDLDKAKFLSDAFGYIVTLSNLLTGIFALVLTRYVSDCIYNKEYKKIMPSLKGGIIISVIPVFVFYLVVYFYLGYNAMLTLLLGVLFGLISITWILISYLGILHDHKEILKTFTIGMLIAFIPMLFIKIIDKQNLQYLVILSMDIGFTVIAALLYSQVKKGFGNGEGSIWGFFEHIVKYPSLVFINIFYLLGLYFEVFYYHFFGTHTDANYLQIYFLSSFVLIPSMIYFMIRFETNYIEKHIELLEYINNGGTRKDILNSKQKLFNTFDFEFGMIVRVTLIFTFIILFFQIYYLNYKEHSETTINSILFLFGMCFTSLLYVLKLILLYFDMRKFALILSTSYLCLNIAIVGIFHLLNIELAGSAFLLSSLMSFFIGLYLVKYLFENLEYYLYKQDS